MPQSPVSAAANALLAVLLAPTCAVCRQSLLAPLDGPVCGACWAAVRPITPPHCDGCGDPLPARHPAGGAAARCPRCRQEPRAIARGRALGDYDGVLRDIVHVLKYDGRRSLAPRLGRLMGECAGDLLEGIDWVVPVPLHPGRQRARGFNQAAELAAALGLPVCAALRRLRATRPQVELPADRRQANVRGAFGLAGRRWWPPRAAGDRLAGRRLLLVDDVCTTGATLEACALVLKRDAGAREVRALTAARVILSGGSATRR